ncbi:DUF4114 domain-containing protein [Synechocystis sp. CACIAM 05]|nr:DUF4114 domain-containing protein [Synechocystis sp. CACIAM 05]
MHPIAVHLPVGMEKCSNLFGFEDIVGGGDLDYNDVILEFFPVI